MAFVILQNCDSISYLQKLVPPGQCVAKQRVTIMWRSKIKMNIEFRFTQLNMQYYLNLNWDILVNCNLISHLTFTMLFDALGKLTQNCEFLISNSRRNLLTSCAGWGHCTADLRGCRVSVAQSGRAAAADQTMDCRAGSVQCRAAAPLQHVKPQTPSNWMQGCLFPD